MVNMRNMKRRKKGPRFIMLEHPLFDSEAFNSLSHTSIRVFLSIIRCKNGINGTSEIPIICPYSSMNGNMSKATIAKCIRELEEKKFIEIVRYGGLMKQPNKYILSAEWINWHKKQTSSSKTKQDRFRK